MSSRTSVVLFHEAASSVREKTVFGMAFMRSATTGAIFWAIGVGQKFVIIS